jgi:hypothetical protein
MSANWLHGLHHHTDQPDELRAMPVFEGQKPAKARRARENSAIVRKLLRQRQPEFAAALASAEHYFFMPSWASEATRST